MERLPSAVRINRRDNSTVGSCTKSISLHIEVFGQDNWPLPRLHVVCEP